MFASLSVRPTPKFPPTLSNLFVATAMVVGGLVSIGTLAVSLSRHPVLPGHPWVAAIPVLILAGLVGAWAQVMITYWHIRRMKRIQEVPDGQAEAVLISRFSSHFRRVFLAVSITYLVVAITGFMRG
jgi:hypothetical protein